MLTANHFVPGSGVGLLLRESRITGKERDTESNLDYFGARYYGSTMGRWLSPDEFAGGPVDVFGGDPTPPGPLPYADITNPQSLNKYSYTYNNPLRYTDPDGHCIEDACVIEGAVALGVALYTYTASPAGQQVIRNGVGALGSIASSLASGISTFAEKLNPYDVGTYKELKDRSSTGDGLDIHHVPQAQPAGQTIEGYDPKTAPGIALPEREHEAIPVDRGDAKRNPRDQLAKDIRDLRNRTHAPDNRIKEVKDKAKQKYPELKKPEKKPETQ